MVVVVSGLGVRGGHDADPGDGGVDGRAESVGVVP